MNLAKNTSNTQVNELSSIILDARIPVISVINKLVAQGIHPLLASLFSSRGIIDISEVRGTVVDILPVDTLKNCKEMASLLADCVENQQRVLIVSDYDCDGATACTVLVAAFRACGMNANYLVPDRKIHGYGLTESIVLEASSLDIKPNFIITVDAGISSNEGVALANQLGMQVLVTDHHHAPAILPLARLIVNPNQPDCSFSSKNIAGCGVAWYVTKALAEELTQRGRVPGYDPMDLLPFVAIGTVADVVMLDRNNRILVSEGLKKIHAGQCTEGVKALAMVSGKLWNSLTCSDIGFNIGPRINAAGRLAHMSTGVECLLTMNPEVADKLSKSLNATNEQRKAIQKTMILEAESGMSTYLKQVDGSINNDARSIVVYGKEWHEGVIGVVAGRIKEEKHRPTFVMCDASNGNIKGSGRSIPGFHLKHALDQIAVENPGIIIGHGGHPMAAGLTIKSGKLEEFKVALEAICQKLLTPKLMQKLVSHDGGLPDACMNLGSIKAMNKEVWGQGFPEPVFIDTMKVIGHRLMGEDKQHLKLNVVKGDVHVDVVAFGEGHRADSLPKEMTLVYKAQINTFRGVDSVQMLASYIPDQGLVLSHLSSQAISEKGKSSEKDEPIASVPAGVFITRRPSGFRRL